ncbi:TonB-dependent receptor [Flavihumibacter rivuli]|uniref:outer membrane beta-barrel protein n=1 Tax=Flavihumibacter rivuli TaxID=2838156 RepID=UPI001BDF4FCB|nr:outer membrane beta-barrel protein [Flavihumibacter rivuli]ULQ57534.1 TonB-dependent receptor [Flavihumibacter rivuli]
MKNFILFILLSFFALPLLAQQSGRLDGQVTDKANQPLEAATISIHRAADKKLVKITTSDKTGKFELENLADGDYSVTVSAVGFKASNNKVTVTGGKSSLPSLAIAMEADDKEMKGVTVTAKKPMVEVKADKTVVNVDAYISNAGASALEVLEKSPGVSVDRDGNISLKGKQGVIIMVDGKQTYLSGQDLANLLRNTPSNQLESVEIMTQPSAKYDAAGNSGIINIRTKKNKQTGFNGTLNLSYIQAKYPKSPNSININYRKNKVNLFAAVNYSYWEGFNDIKINRKFGVKGTEELAAVFDQSTYGHFKNKNLSSKVGMDYSIDKNTTIGFQVNGTYNPRNWNSSGTANIYDGQGQLDSSNVAFSINDDIWKNYGANINFRKLLDTTGREITADIDYLGYESNSKQSSFNYTYYHPGNTLEDSFLLKGHLPSEIRIISAKVDYSQRLGKQGRLEAGLKSSLVKTDNDAKFTNWDAGAKDWVIDSGRSNHFLYDENINAAYVNYSTQWKKWSLQTGLRLEHTHAKGRQLANNESFTRDYVQLFPTAFASYKLNDKNTFNLSYGRRIERPSYQDMNPFQYFLDQYTYRQGNPYLLPQLSQNIELSHNFKGSLNTSINYTVTTDVINDILKQIDSLKVTYQTKENLSKRRNIGLSISYNKPLTKWWSVSLFGNIFNNKFEGEVDGTTLDANMTAFMVNMNNQFKLPKGWGAEMSGFYRSKMQDGGLIISEPMYVVNFGFSKQVMKSKGTIKLNISDPFYIQQFRGYTKFGAIDTQIRSKWDNRRLGLSFTYRFGKTQNNGPAPRRRTGSAQDEQNRVGGGNQQ